MTDKTKIKLNIPVDGMKRTILPTLGKVIETTQKGIYAVKEPAIIGKQYIVTCPVCGKPVLVKATEAKIIKVMHNTCNIPIIIKGSMQNVSDKASAAEVKETTDKQVYAGNKTNAKLSWWSLTGRQYFILRIGKNYVGRKDSDNPSDLSLKDEYASARSICIEVSQTARGYTFHLTVERATNPVLINGKEHVAGSSFDLNYGDIIKLGKTTLTFNPVKK